MSKKNYTSLKSGTDIRGTAVDGVKGEALELTDEAKNLICDTAYDPIYGARPLKRFIQSKVETLIAREMIERDIAPESTVIVNGENGILTVSVKDPAPVEA